MGVKVALPSAVTCAICFCSDVVTHIVASGPVASVWSSTGSSADTDGPGFSSPCASTRSRDRMPAENHAWPSGPSAPGPSTRNDTEVVAKRPSGNARPTATLSMPRAMRTHAPPSGLATRVVMVEPRFTCATSAACAGALASNVSATARLRV